MSRYAHVVRAVTGAPWAILPETYSLILSIVSDRVAGITLSEEEIHDRVAAAVNGPRRGGGQQQSVAVLPLYGVLTQRANLMANMSGGTSLEQFTQAFRSVLADESVSAIVLDVDSPGGSVDGVEELAAEIRAARGRKPIVAVANAMAASAAYWIATAADELIVTPSGQVGSIGVLAAHADFSKAEETAGIKHTLISAGKFKTEGNQFEPLGDDAKAAIQDQVDRYYSMFVAAVSKGRGVPAKTVKDDFGQGRMLLAKPALDAGMVDRIDTLDNTVRRLMSARVTRSSSTAEADEAPIQASTDDGTPPAGLPFATHVERVLRDVTALSDRAGEIKALRAESGRDLSEPNRERLAELVAQCSAVQKQLEDMLTAPARATATNPVTDLVVEAYRRGYDAKELING